MKGSLYYIITGNDFGQILVFESNEAATRWAETATRWSAAEIARNIKVAPVDNRGFYSIFQV